MGIDIEIYTEGLIDVWKDGNRRKMWTNIDHWRRARTYDSVFLGIPINECDEFRHIPIFDFESSYVYYMLCGIHYQSDDVSNWPSPVSVPKGLPTDRDELVISRETYPDYREPDTGGIFCCPSHLTLKELKDSGYGTLRHLKGWVKEDQYLAAAAQSNSGIGCCFDFFSIDSPRGGEPGYVLREWDGYIDGYHACFASLINKLELLKKENRIEQDDEIRIIFWFDM